MTVLKTRPKSISRRFKQQKEAVAKAKKEPEKTEGQSAHWGLTRPLAVIRLDQGGPHQ
jgi:hypothetical protein